VLEKAFCIFCSLPMRVYSKKHVGIFAMIMFGVVGAIFSYLVWERFHLVALLLFAILTVVTEFIFHLRWRSSVKCKGCGFDPVLYKQNPELAASFVKAKLDSRKQDPLYMLKPRPTIKPIIRKVKSLKSPSKDLQI
jgi:hypothetical protein